MLLKCVYLSNSEHCVVEYNGEVVVLHPKAPLCTVDGIPITEPTKLPQGEIYQRTRHSIPSQK